MFDITKRTTITTDWAQLKTVQEQMNLAEIMLEVGSEFPICLGGGTQTMRMMCLSS